MEIIRLILCNIFRQSWSKTSWGDENLSQAGANKVLYLITNGIAYK